MYVTMLHCIYDTKLYYIMRTSPILTLASRTTGPAPGVKSAGPNAAWSRGHARRRRRR